MQPYILWSEGIDHVTVKIDLENIENEEIIIEKDKIFGKLTSEEKEYSFNVNLLNEIIVQESYYNKFRFIEFYLKKNENKRWEYLTSLKDSKINVDWNKQILDDDDDLLIEELSDNDDRTIDYSSSDESENDNYFKDFNLENLELSEL